MAPQPFIGEIRLFAGDRAPTDWLLCDGQLLAIAEFDALFNLIGTTYGGDGETTFAVPDLRCRVPIHMGARTGGPAYALGATGGAETETLTLDQLPNHSHVLAASDAPGSLNPPTGGVLARATSTQPGMVMYGTDSSAPMNPAAIDAVGNGKAHENMQPFLATCFIISPYGLYPAP